LEGRVREMVQAAQMDTLLQKEYRQLFELGKMGQTEYLAKDPLGLRNLFLARMSAAMPFNVGNLYRGHIISKDRKGLLVIAQPLRSAQDTSFARHLSALLETTKAQLKKVSRPEGIQFEMVYAGAFRAAQENERIIRRDSSRTLTVVMIGLTLLVLISFRRPWFGILAMLPAMAGVMMATFFYALMRDSIFAISLGFGGALIAIAVDHGLAYVVLLDSPYEKKGLEISREVWSVTSVTVLTTIAALLSLAVLGIPLFTEVGLFAAMGVGFSALFVHLFFPTLFFRLKGSKREKPMILERLTHWLNVFSNWTTVLLCIAFVLVMLFFIRFEFNVDLTSMNRVAPDTIEAEETIKKTWGDLSNKVYIMAAGQTKDDLTHEIERLSDFLDRERDNAILSSGMPLGAMIAKAEIMDWEAGSHASTFGGNPVSCQAALATIQLLEESLMKNAEEQGRRMMEKLRLMQTDYECIGDVRGLGLMIGVELVKDRKTKERAGDWRNAIMAKAFKKGLLLL